MVKKNTVTIVQKTETMSTLLLCLILLVQNTLGKIFVPGSGCGISNPINFADKSGSKCSFVDKNALVGGSWGEWSAASPCSATCGAGTRTLARICNNPEPQNGGKLCPWSANKQVDCNEGSCPGKS